MTDRRRPRHGGEGDDGSTIVPPSADVVMHAMRQHRCPIIVEGLGAVVVIDPCPCEIAKKLLCPSCFDTLAISAPRRELWCDHAEEWILHE